MNANMDIKIFLNADHSLKNAVEINSRIYTHEGIVNSYKETDFHIYVNHHSDPNLDEDTIIVFRNNITGAATLK